MENMTFLTQTNNNQTSSKTITIQEPSFSYLIDKLSDVALKNEGFGLIIGSGIATSIIIYAIAKAVTEIIKAIYRKS